MNTNFKCNKG